MATKLQKIEYGIVAVALALTIPALHGHYRVATKPGAPLTPAELKQAQKIFGNSINYDLVRTHDGAIGVTGAVPLTPWSNPDKPVHIIFGKKANRPFTFELGTSVGLFVHEMEHVRRFQSKQKLSQQLVDLMHANINKAFMLFNSKWLYKYKKSTPFRELNLEQQADFVADYAIAKHQHQSRVDQIKEFTPERPAYPRYAEVFNENCQEMAQAEQAFGQDFPYIAHEPACDAVGKLFEDENFRKLPKEKQTEIAIEQILANHIS